MKKFSEYVKDGVVVLFGKEQIFLTNSDVKTLKNWLNKNVK